MLQHAAPQWPELRAIVSHVAANHSTSLRLKVPGLYGYGLHSYGLHSYSHVTANHSTSLWLKVPGLYGYGLHSYGLYSHSHVAANHSTSLRLKVPCAHTRVFVSVLACIHTLVHASDRRHAPKFAKNRHAYRACMRAIVGRSCLKRSSASDLRVERIFLKNISEDAAGEGRRRGGRSKGT